MNLPVTIYLNDMNLSEDVEHYFYTMSGQKYLKNGQMTISFFCDRCRFDFDGEAVEDEVAGDTLWVRKCPKCVQKVWRIQNSAEDPYFKRSIKLERMRIEYAKDLLQPGQPGYKELYGDPFKKFYEAQEKKERDEWERIRKSDVSIRQVSF